jgi:endonuclease YncB( thermonuclease family)
MRNENHPGVERLAPVPAMEAEPRGRIDPAASYPVTVVEVKDDAAIVVLSASAQKKSSNAKNRVTVRLYGIDFPEPGQPQARDAADFVRNAVLHKNVEVMTSPLEKDKSGRTVATVETSGRPLQELLLEAGLARVSPACGRPECACWKRLENEARTAKTGRWKE